MGRLGVQLHRPVRGHVQVAGGPLPAEERHADGLVDLEPHRGDDACAEEDGDADGVHALEGEEGD